MGSVCCSCSAATPTSRQIACMTGDLDRPVGTPIKGASISAKGFGSPAFGNSAVLATQSRSHTLASFGQSCNEDTSATMASASQNPINPKGLSISGLRTRGLHESVTASPVIRQGSNSASTVSTSAALAVLTSAATLTGLEAHNNNTISITSGGSNFSPRVAGDPQAMNSLVSVHPNTGKSAVLVNRNSASVRPPSLVNSDGVGASLMQRYPSEPPRQQGAQIRGPSGVKVSPLRQAIPFQGSYGPVAQR
eukprot:GILI01017035.1.p1 GENE.GILI01017035.1~~GILI01017035.1.p1  ORF type:complete len:250 (+),score=19.04 GILI01017035.1:391-1140(+)